MRVLNNSNLNWGNFITSLIRSILKFNKILKCKINSQGEFGRPMTGSVKLTTTNWRDSLNRILSHSFHINKNLVYGSIENQPEFYLARFAVFNILFIIVIDVISINTYSWINNNYCKSTSHGLYTYR